MLQVLPPSVVAENQAGPRKAGVTEKAVGLALTLGETSRYLLPYLATMTAVAAVIAFLPWLVYLVPYLFGLYTPR